MPLTALPQLASRPRAASSGRRALLLVAAMALAAAPGLADAEASFKKALIAIDRQRFNEAVGHLQTAIGERPREAKTEVRIYGTWYEPYLPHYYLGVALARSGDCGGALAAWAEAKRQGVVGGTPRAATLAQLEKDCLAPTLLRAQQAVEADLLTANRLWQELEALLATPATRLAAERDPDFARRRAGARHDLDEAGRAVEEAKAQASLARMEQARELASTAGDQLKAITQRARAAQELVAATPAAAPTAPASAAPAAPAAPSPAATAPVPTGSPLGTPASTPPSGPSTGGSPALAGPTEPPQQLVAAADAFLAGDYQGALQRLAGRRSADRRDRAATALLRSAAAAALAWRGGDGAAELLRQAALDAAQCKQLQPELVLDGRFFSPRFRAFYAAAH